MQSRSPASNLGIYAYAAGAIFLGLLGLASGDFAGSWQSVGPNVPFREPLAYLTAFIELAAGLALLMRAPNGSRRRLDAHPRLLRFHTLVGAQNSRRPERLRPHRQLL